MRPGTTKTLFLDTLAPLVGLYVKQLAKIVHCIVYVYILLVVFLFISRDIFRIYIFIFYT